jgi:hypothetical protein
METRPQPDELPPALERALRASRAAPPAELDGAVLAAARPVLAGHARRRRARLALRLVAPLAAAAAVALVLLPRWSANFSEHRLARREDLDGNGRIDILDAFQLARELDGGVLQPPARDFTGDGSVDRADVDRLARLAVRIGT